MYLNVDYSTNDFHGGWEFSNLIATHLVFRKTIWNVNTFAIQNVLFSYKI